MEAVYFKTDTSEPACVYCTDDGKIDFTELAQEFGLEITSIKLNGDRFPKTLPETGLKSASKWEQIRDIFLQNRYPLGTRADPVLVTGNPRPVAPTGTPKTDKTLSIRKRILGERVAVCRLDQLQV